MTRFFTFIGGLKTGTRIAGIKSLMISHRLNSKTTLDGWFFTFDSWFFKERWIWSVLGFGLLPFN